MPCRSQLMPNKGEPQSSNGLHLLPDEKEVREREEREREHAGAQERYICREREFVRGTHAHTHKEKKKKTT